MEQLPSYISWVFCLTTIFALIIFYKATFYSRYFIVVSLMWLLLQTIVALSGFYTNTHTLPPRFLLLILPPVIFIAILFNTVSGKDFIDSLDIKTLTLFHMIRIPVEIILLWLSINKTVPSLMTFEGRNFDILSGITAPLLYYLTWKKIKPNKTVLLAWNFLCLALLLNIVVNAALSVPSPLQQFAFDQPNIAILYFPYVLLPGFLVPLVLFAHLAAIRQLVYSIQPAPKLSTQ